MNRTRPKPFQVFKFEDILPLLVGIYEGGQLVPFIGAGMSRRKLANWEGFVANLERLADTDSDAGAGPSQGRRHASGGHLEIRAQRAAATLRNRFAEKEFWYRLTEALKGEDFDNPEIPPQTRALAGIYWPLTISTNYDHLFFCACRQQSETRLDPVILGRSAMDCKQVMSSLFSPFDREIIWHIQGFLGERCQHCRPGALPDKHHLRTLRRELVISHSEYRRAANTAVHFRRCFGEVFMSRSFLFLGSSLSEDYFWNLFGETLELCGPSSAPHFAFLPKQARSNFRFLTEEMNITVCEYSDPAEIVVWLNQLTGLIKRTSKRLVGWQVKIESGSILEIAPHRPLGMPEKHRDSAVAIVVQAPPEKGGKFRLDLEPDLENLKSNFSGRRFREGQRVLCVANGLFAVRARTKSDRNTERDAVGAAVRDLLRRLHGRSVLHLHLPSAGGTVPPVYGFIEAVRAFGNWARRNKRSLHLIAHVGHQVLLNLTSRQISLYELLDSSLIRFWTLVNSDDGEATRRVLYKTPGTKLKAVVEELLGDMNEDAFRKWSISVCPSPKREPRPLLKKDLDMALCDVGIVFGSVLTLHRRSAQEKNLDEKTMPKARNTAAGA